MLTPKQKDWRCEVSWLQKLYETYEACAGSPQFQKGLTPECHTEKQAHIEIAIDGLGNFLRATILDKEITTIPATEASAGRTGKKPAPHPLCDKLLYCAGDYLQHGGTRTSFFDEYISQLRLWLASEPNPKIAAVLTYVEKKNIVSDLLRAQVLHADPDGVLTTEWTTSGPMPTLLRLLPPPKGKLRDQGDAFVRWRVEIPGDRVSATWEDPEVRAAWIRFDGGQESTHGLCMVTGETTIVAKNHPKRLRDAKDQAKLISGNDKTGYTFRGRMDQAWQACGVGLTATQRAHSALRWLIERQAHRSGGQVYVAWSVRGKGIPDPLSDTARLFLDAQLEDDTEETAYAGDTGQQFALRLKKAIAGYRAGLTGSDEIVVMGMDSAVPGRMAIKYYRELGADDFLAKVTDWHTKYSWPQRYSKELRFVGAPAPGDIAEAAYGRRLDDKLRRSTVELLLPSIVDGRRIPRGIVEACVRQACSRAGKQDQQGKRSSNVNWGWEKCLGIACALVRGHSEEENYEMSLEEDRDTRDYLFGRLLAIADNIEQRALHLAKETRETTALRLLQRFADHPCSTWRTIETALVPYKARLRTNRPKDLLKREKLLDVVFSQFRSEDFVSDSKLSGEFLLGYHCQRARLWANEATSGELKQNVQDSGSERTDND
jgi:CRISPR-associated protein Csd1